MLRHIGGRPAAPQRTDAVTAHAANYLGVERTHRYASHSSHRARFTNRSPAFS